MLYFLIKHTLKYRYVISGIHFFSYRVSLEKWVSLNSRKPCSLVKPYTKNAFLRAFMDFMAFIALGAGTAPLLPTALPALGMVKG